MKATGFLCDAATVRDGLLHVLGGGVTRTFSPEYPAPLGVVFASILEFEQATDPPGAYQVVVRVLSEDGKEQFLAASGEIRIDYVETPDSSLPGLVPFVVGLSNTELPRPGHYRVLVLVNGDEVWACTFGAYRGTIGDHESLGLRPTTPTAPVRSE
ncbi:MAG TPA: hypothetical protein PLZ93_00465 [Nocardioides sp.]|uniref:DUF6941 family protein n=1 Tax=uncultured Nocardioides sp. TaxID=198441 RepID=UPI000EEBEFE6|nr:hypothetical protein [uncultured Nocardioides sp.]HCB05154.1 hypothetical protein [Nocardioides sp.]HRD63863.1 hypothetical protein [Nocardioides sp.]HRI94065.1 hypothetical protein [Nocardioides sp.]HRK44128.1 hypothetical protein [Nocardioides sp.]